MRRIKDEEERKRLLQRGQELSEQYEKNRQAVHQAEAQTIKNSKVHWVDPTATGFKGVTNRIGWIGRNAKAGGEKSLLDTLSAFGQTTQVGLQRGANQAAQEQTTWDKIKNYGKNALKSYAYTSPDMISKLLYMSTIGRQDMINENNQVASQIAQNYNQAQTGFGKFGAIAGGVTSKVIQDNNSLAQGLYAGGQQVGQLIGEDRANQATQKILEADTKLHEKNDKRLEELQRQGTLYGGVTRKLGETGQTIGYMTPSIAIGLATGGAGETAGLVQMGLAAKGSTTREAMQQGANLETAERKGVASGTAEAASEKMFGGLKAFKPFKESGVEDVAKKYIAETIEKRISSQLGQTVAKTAGNWLVDVTGETIEELTTDIYNTWLDQATTDPNAEYTLDDAINTAVGTALSTTVLNVGYTGLNKGIQKVYDRNQARANNQESIPEAERIESNGYKENLQEMVNNLDIPEEVKAQIQPMLDSNATINAEEYKDITNNIKTLVKANTQQQIADYGAELTTQYNAIEEQRQSLDNIKPENFKDQESRRFYAQQMNKEFSDNTLDTILATYPENRNGNRTVKQYKEIAKAYGQQMALNGLTFDEVRANTVGAWQYYEPNKNITRYDNQQKKNASFERLNSQVWSEEVYNSYRDTMKAQLDQQQKDLADTANARLEEIQDKENITLMTIDDLKPKIEAVKSSLVQSAEQYGYKGKQISEIQDLMKRRGINAYFDETQFNDDSEGAFYNPKTNEIVFNPNASQDQVIQELAVHEWYHDLVAKGQGSEIQQSVIDFLKNNKDYQDLRKSLENAYAKLTDPNTGEYLYDIESKEFSDMIDEEATAKTLQRVLGNETEIQRLINYKPSLARRIYDAVVDLLNKFTGGRIEKLYWQDVRNKFEAAFNENGISTNSDIRYSVKTDSQGRELSEEQQEYFKDSKVRDRVGNLLTLYHGTGNNFNVFDISTLGKGQKNAGNFGDGFYFTPNKNIANQYAKNDNIKEVYVDIKNPFIYTQLNEINGENTFSDYAGIYNLVNLNQEWGDIPVKYGSKQTWNDIKNAVETYIKNGEDIYNIDEKLYSEFGDLPEQTLNDRIYTYSKNNGYKTFREVLQEKGYDGIFSDDAQSDNTQYVAFNSNQIKNVDNKAPTTNSDIRYSVNTDNQGNEINPGMQEYLEDVSPEELVDGKVPLVYHTTTDEISQFNIFNPVGTPYYRFGDQVVNYYTDSKDMSGSYASSKYKMADTKKLNNIEETKQYLYDYGRTTGNLLTISQNESGKYVLNQEKQTNNEARNFVDNLSEDEIQQMRDNIFYDKDMEGTPYEYAFSWDKFDKSLQEKFKNVTDKYTGTADLVDLENEIMKYVRQPELLLNNDSINGEIVKEYSSEDELLRNIKEDIGKTNWSKNSRVQYQGYVKLTNPYVVDAEERNWNQVVSQSNDFIDELTETVSEDTINNLSRLYKESQEISADARAEYYKYDNIIQSINTPDIGFNEYTVDNDTQSMNHLLRRTSLNDILLLDSRDTNLGVSTWFNIADVLQQDGIIGEATAKNITDDFKLPEQVKNWIHNELYKEINVGLEDVHNLKELYEKKNEAYQKFDKYRYETSYFKEKIMADESEEGYVDLGELNDLLEQRAEVRGADVVADEIAQASSVGFSKPELIRLWGTSKTTNDIVKEVIASNQDGTTNYDGVIIKNVYDYGGKAEGETKPANVYVTFNSNQFKAQDNQNPTADPDIRYQNETNFDDWANNNLPSLGEGKTTLSDLRTEQRLPVNQPETTQLPTTKKTQTISSTIEEPTLKVPVPKGNTGTEQKVAKVLSEPITKVKPEQRAWALFKANILDKGAVFEDLSFKSKNRELQAKWDSTLLADAKGQNAIGQARYEFENGEEKQVSKALTDIIDEVGENSEDFNNYMYHQLNIDRMTLEDRFDIANKPVFGDGIDANYSKQKVAELEKAHPEFKEYAQDVYDYLDTNKKELVDNGVISQETSDKFKEMYPHYVPIARIDAKGQAINVPLDTNRTGINSPIKKAKGGSQDIQPLFQTMANRTMQTYKASSRNSFGLELKNTLNNLGMFNQLENAVENTDSENIFEYDADKGNLQEGNKYQNPTFTVFENGEKVTYEINQDMYDALRPKNEIFSKWDNTKLMKATRKFNDIRRGILTEYNPAFSITNAIKDAQDVLMNSQHAGKTYAKFGEAYSQILKKGYWYKEYVQNGGSQNSYFTDGDFVKQDGKVKSIIKMPLEAISKVNNVIEMSPRLAEYIASREQGKSIQSAMLDASRVTTNFKAGGDVTKFLNRNGATFLNASVQGLQQNIRNIREANAKGLKGYGVLLGKAVIAGLPALILNNLVWKDDDDYEELQDYVKDNYYIIAKIGDHKFLRIPKGRTVAVIQKAVTNMSDFITNKDEIDPDKYSEVIWGDLKDTFELASNNLAPNNPIENNIVSPIVQAVNNKTWYGEDLVPSRLKDKPNEEKYDESTAEISKQISGVLNKIGIKSNPMQINYLLDQYGGGVADVLLPMGTPQAENNMIEDKFTTDSVMKSRYPGEFFELKDKLAENRNSSKATDEDELLYKYADNVSGELSDLYKKKREIQNSSLTDKEKKKQIAEVQKQINSKTQQALKDIKEPKVSGDTATIGNSEYIKTLNANSGEYQWNKLTDKTKIQGISLKTQADYQNRLAKYKQKTGDSQLSDKEEAQIILDGNYSSKDKKAIYIATAGKKDTLYKSVSDNLNIDEYLNYKTANIQGVKGSNGKTISGTKETAQLNYINENISGYENRLLLMGKDYKLSRSQQQDLAQYIYTLDNAEDLFEMYSKNFTIKNGNVYYK